MSPSILDNPNLLLTASALTAAAVAIATALYFRSRSRAGSFPPGPPSKPFVGNLLALPAEAPWEALTKFKEEYSDLVFFHGLGNYTLVLNTMDAILDLFEKKAMIYSDRPISVSLYELIGFSNVLPLMPYNKEWKAQRRIVRQGLNPTTVKDYGSIQEDLAILFTKQLLDNPDGFDAHIRLVTSRTVASVSYGLPTGEPGASYIEHAEETITLINDSLIPGSYLCDSIPLMKYLPSWMPFHKRAYKTKMMFQSMITKPLDYVKAQMNQGRPLKGMTKDLLAADVENYDEHENRVKYAVGSLYAAGGETSYATILSLTLAMVLHPDKQCLAQREIDEAIGAGNLPTLNDRGRLPYLDAVIKEVMRWRPPLPISLPRRSTQDDIYRGYTIPKGTIIIPNVWAIAHEQHEKYDPSEFVPERFLEDQTLLDPAIYVFGFARRLCPGKALAENSLFIYISTMLACFDILTPADGTPVRNEYLKTGIVSYPMPFKCQWKVRSPVRVALIVDKAAHVAL